MWTIFEIIMDILSLYDRDVGTWIVNIFLWLGTIGCLFAAVLFFAAGIWPLGLFLGALAVYLFILLCKSPRD